MNKQFEIKRLHDTEDIDTAIALSHKTFMEFEAPDYSKEGVDSFMNFIYGDSIKTKTKAGTFIFWGCYYGNRMVGMMALRDGSHISLAFTHKDFHRQGIGRMLFLALREYVVKQGLHTNITLNSSPYGLPFYIAIGFIPTDMERIDDGIRYTPMKYELKE